MEDLLDRLERGRISPRRAILLCAVFVIAAGAIVPQLVERARARQTQTIRLAGPVQPRGSEASAEPQLLVDVAGAVQRPGVYRLPHGSRVLHALERAGGPAAGANLAALNRAAELVDGQQIVVPAEQAKQVPAAAPARVSLNSADLAALDDLPGIGPVTAQRIIDDRSSNGPFAGVEDLDRVPGIGAATVEQLRELVGP